MIWFQLYFLWIFSKIATKRQSAEKLKSLALFTALNLYNLHENS